MHSISTPASGCAIAAAVALAGLSPVADAGAPAPHPKPEPIVVKIDDGFHWGDAGIGAAAGVGAALLAAGGLVLLRSADRVAAEESSHREEQR
jgi:hypothetical protein